MSKEYQEGFDAWMKHSKGADANPYPPETTQHKDWTEGHLVAVLGDGEL